MTDAVTPGLPAPRQDAPHAPRRNRLWAVAAVLWLLFVLGVVTFSIFYLVPRLAGASPETLAARYVGRAATPETVLGPRRPSRMPLPSATRRPERRFALRFVEALASAVLGGGP